MQSLRRVRKFVVLAALVWLPMSVFAQICATSAQVGRLAGTLSPLMVTSVESAHSYALATHITPVEVNNADCGCDMSAVCDFAALSVLAPDAVLMIANTLAPSGPIRHFNAFSTRSLVPDTPPPRHCLLT